MSNVLEIMPPLQDLFFEKGTLTVIVHTAVIYARLPSTRAYCKLLVDEGGWNTLKEGKSGTVEHTGNPEWDWHWSTSVTNLGTTEHPTELKIQVYAERSFLPDVLIGKVEIPIYAWADAEEKDLRLPLWLKSSWSGEEEGGCEEFIDS
eukprot:TRINITY_DN14073_c0_g1_i2.p1 TRINITY_DN14073_c0_g1~~TRINITY_DN14073_c0_g1_i2.p1  ORF type:complete len:148 (-),score=33.73 TRINITY_DN14073_c0_g1_i2:245-688(-)